MVQAQRSPRCRGWKDEAPGSEALHGKPWHFEDPHTCYRFIKVLGTGYYGVTYLCSNQHTGEFVAIKALDKLHPEYEREEAVEEILVLAAVCDHPNVVALHEVWEDASHIFIVMEACLGGELFDVVIERKFFTEADAASITAAVLSVIQHCHGKGIIHRDLKPENFLLLHPGELSANNLRAIDFGLAKFVRGGDGIFHSRVGSAYYVAPEVLKGAYSFEADAWSVGTIAYVLLSGFPPFWGSSDQIIFHRILNRPVDFDYQPWHQISAAAKDFVCRLLDKDPSTRMSVAQALLHPWITQEAATLPLSTEIIDRMQNFTHQNRIKCLLMTVAARHLSDEEIGGLRKVFHFIDADADGEISVHDLSVALRTAGLELGEADVAGLLAGLDLAHHGTVHVDEFIAAALDQRRVLTANTVNAIFAELDQDRDGLITVAQLQEALQACRVSCTSDSLERLMRRQGALDTRGMVSSQSFASLLLHGDDAAEPLEQLEKWWADVQQFSAATRVRRLAMLVAALHMDPEEVRGPRHLEHLQAAMRHEGKEVGEQELRGLLEALDTCRQGSIALDQFLAACLEEEHLTDTRLRAAFDFFDRDGSGVVTEADMKQALTELCIDPSQAGELLAAACGGSPPTNSPRSLSFEAFCRMLLNQMPETATRRWIRLRARAACPWQGSSSLCRVHPGQQGRHRPI